MSQIVKCDICGKIYNQSYLGSHKRLSHGKPQAPTLSPQSDAASLELIFSLYEQLPEEQKKEVLNRLARGDQTKR